MINLRDARITDGLPRIVAAQPWAQVLSAVYGELQGKMLELLDEGVTFFEADNCTEEMLDQMAVYLKIEWYDSTASIETKRKAVKVAIEIQRYAGTVKAVREQVNSIYQNAEIKEWFDYGGTPGYWRLKVNAEDSDIQYYSIEEMERLLGYTKRLSAHLERITYVTKPKENPRAYVAAAPFSMVASCVVRMPGIIKPRAVTARGYAAGAVSAARMQTTVELPGTINPKKFTAQAFDSGGLAHTHETVTIKLGGKSL